MGLWEDIKNYFSSDIAEGGVNPRASLNTENTAPPIPYGASQVIPKQEIPASTLEKPSLVSQENAIINSLYKAPKESAPVQEQVNQADFINPAESIIGQQQAQPQQQTQINALSAIKGLTDIKPVIAGADFRGYDESLEDYKKAFAEEQKVAQEKNKRIVEQYNGLSDAVKQYAKTDENIQNLIKMRLDIDKRIANQERIVKELEDTSSKKIDPDRFWSNKETWQKSLIIIGQAMAAFASGFSGRENFAFKLLTQQIEQDIDAQKEEIKNATTKKINAENNIQSLINAGFTINQAESMAKTTMYNQLLAKLQATSALTTTDAETKANIDKAIAALGQKAEEEKLKVRTDLSKENAKNLNAFNAKKMESTEQVLKMLAKTQKPTVYSGNPIYNVITKKFEGSDDNVYNKEMYKKFMDQAAVANKFFGKEGAIYYDGLTKLAETGTFDKIFSSYLGGKKEITEQVRAEMAAEIIKNIPGLRSDNDFIRVVTPMLPSVFSTASTTKDVIQRLGEKFEATAYASMDMFQYNDDPNLRHAINVTKSRGGENSFINAQKRFLKSLKTLGGE